MLDLRKEEKIKTTSIEQFYNNFASHYHELFNNWDNSIKYHSRCISNLLKRKFEFRNENQISILDCSCGIGTQAIGLALLGYNVHGSDISKKEIERAKRESKRFKVSIKYVVSDFRELSNKINNKYNVVISCDNSLPHLLEKNDLEKTFIEINKKLEINGIFLASIRDYD